MGRWEPCNRSTWRVDREGIHYTHVALEYSSVLRDAESLSKDERIRLIAELSKRLHGPSGDGSRKSILSLQGLGKEMWLISMLRNM